MVLFTQDNANPHIAAIAVECIDDTAVEIFFTLVV
jgi:hypothetical protein